MKGPVAVTGGTGFIGREVIRRLLDDGWPVRALTRRSDQDLEGAGVVPIRGALEDETALAQLVAGAAFVIHCAGAIVAPTSAAFREVNSLGAARLMAAAGRTAARPRLIHLSSLAAREPALSAYASSKRSGEEQVRRAAGERIDLCILRPPAVYGPRDRATLPIFRQLQRGLLFVPAVPDARFSLLYVADLARLIVRLLDQLRWGGLLIEPDDGRAAGYGWRDLADIAGRRRGRRVRTVGVPRAALWPAALVGEAVGTALGRAPWLSRGKLRELFHPDWVCGTTTQPPLAGWSACTTFEGGYAKTITWYEHHRWL